MMSLMGFKGGKVGKVPEATDFHTFEHYSNAPTMVATGLSPRAIADTSG